jgi:hypothetical protein
VASVSITVRNGLPTTPITVNGKPITNPTDIRNLIAAETRSIEVANSFRGKPITQESQNATREARAAVDSAATVAFNNAQAASAPPSSSGQNVGEGQRAREDGANTQNPPQTPLTTGPNGRVQPAAAPPPTNAQRPSTTPTSGTNAPTRPSSATQAVPPPTATPNLSQSAGAPGSPPTLPAPGPIASAARTSGVAAGINEPAGNEVLARLQTLFNTSDTAIKSQPNAHNFFKY